MGNSYGDFYERSPLSKAKGGFKKFGLWLLGAIGMGGIIAAYVGAVATEVLPAPRDVLCLAREQFHDPAPGTHFTILISNLAGDPDGRQARHVRDMFLNEGGFDVRRTCRVVTLDAIGGSVADAAAQALDEGRALLADWNADLLIWGEVKKADQELSLWFLGGGESTLGAPSYTLTEKLTLPEEFQADLGTQIVAVAAAQVALSTEQAGRYLVDLLRPVAAKLGRLIENPPPGLGPEGVVELLFSLALASQAIGEQSGERQPLERAVLAYRAVLERWTRERAPHDWAMTQNNLGNALRDLSEHEMGSARLEEAVAAYLAALQEWTRERAPLQWAMTQNNLGTALRPLGIRESGTARLKEAVAAYGAALQEWTRERVPLQWAMTQNNLGNALTSLGERESGTARLEEAVAALRAALEERTRERAPLEWAMTQNNLGHTLHILGARENSTARLEEALAALRAAIEERTRERVPLEWARTQFNLGKVLRSLGEQDSGTARSEESIAAFRHALEERTRERAPLLRADTQENLGLALLAWGERGDGVAKLEQAVEAIGAALKTFREAGATYNIEKAERNHARAKQVLAERRSASLAAESSTAEKRVRGRPGGSPRSPPH
jgi:tetratricopeptide (TPR) repeat protein